MRYFLHTTPNSLALVGEDGRKIEMVYTRFLQANSIGSGIAGFLNKDDQPCVFARDFQHVSEMTRKLAGHKVAQLQIVCLDMSDEKIVSETPGDVLAEAYAFGDFIVDGEDMKISRIAALAEALMEGLSIPAAAGAGQLHPLPQDGITDSEPCNIPPEGWWCSRDKGHEGPCAASKWGSE